MYMLFFFSEFARLQSFFFPEFARLQSFFFFSPRVCQTLGPSNSPPRMSRGGPRHLLHHASASGCHTLCSKWVGQGGKSTLATAPDADILREIICLLTQRVRAGRATFLIKVKSHRGEPINERADTLVEEGRTISDDDKRWDDRTDRMTF
jgi:hypothetical protein